MASKEILTTGDIAAHCYVSYETVANWIRAGKLQSFSTPGRHRRIKADDFKEFLRQYDMPPYGKDTSVATKLLIVDDEPEIVQLISSFFARLPGYEVESAADGFEAGIHVERFKPDLIILDLLMPQVDGFNVCKMIKSNPDTNHIGILVLTGYTEGENLKRAQECGADECMSKPFKLGGLKKHVDEFVSRQVIA
jgi:excisionase family DNA binding protein